MLEKTYRTGGYHKIVWEKGAFLKGTHFSTQKSKPPPPRFYPNRPNDSLMGYSLATFAKPGALPPPHTHHRGTVQTNPAVDTAVPTPTPAPASAPDPRPAPTPLDPPPALPASPPPRPSPVIASACAALAVAAVAAACSRPQRRPGCPPSLGRRMGIQCAGEPTGGEDGGKSLLK